MLRLFLPKIFILFILLKSLFFILSLVEIKKSTFQVYLSLFITTHRDGSREQLKEGLLTVE